MRICLTLYIGSSLVLVWNGGPCLDPGAPTVALWSDVRETDWLRPLALWKQTSAIQISGWPVSQHSSWLLHFQLSLRAIFHRGTPTSSSNASSLSFTYLHYFVLFLSVSWISFSPLSFFQSLLACFSFSLPPPLLNLYSHFTSILLNLLVVILSLPLSPASSSFLSLSAPICQAHSPPPTVMYSELLRTGE